MRNGKWFVVLGLVALVGLGIWWWQSSASDPAQEKMAEELTPEISVTNLRITDIGEHHINITSEVIIKNPFPVELSSSSMEYQVYIDSILVIEDVHNQPVTIASSDSTVIELPMEIKRDPMGRVLQYFKDQNVDSAHYALESSIVLDVPIEGEEEFSMRIADTLPTFQMVSTKLEDAETNLLSSDEGIELVLRMTNPNQYPVETRNGSFSFTIRDELEVNGQVEDMVIPPGGTQDVAVYAEKKWGSVTQAGQDFLFNKEDTRFSYHFNGTLYSENEVLNDTEVNMTMEGTLDELANLISF